MSSNCISGIKAARYVDHLGRTTRYVRNKIPPCPNVCCKHSAALHFKIGKRETQNTFPKCWPIVIVQVLTTKQTVYTCLVTNWNTIKFIYFQIDYSQTATLDCNNLLLIGSLIYN